MAEFLRLADEARVRRIYGSLTHSDLAEKGLGVEMGAPEFKMRALMKANGMRVFSSNYTLYGDMSARMMQTLASTAPSTEVYSIDECFLDYDGIADPVGHAIATRAKVKQWTGIPVSIGIAETKVLAKAANRLAKMKRREIGVLRITNENREEWLRQLPVEKVWGIGRAHSSQLLARGVKTAWDFAKHDKGEVRRTMGVVGERVVYELEGISCLALEEIQPAKKQIICAKGFGSPLTDLADIEMALASYANTVAEKLRSQGSVCGAMQVFLLTNPHRLDQPQFNPAMTLTIPEATSYSPALISTALRILRKIYRPGFLFRKVGSCSWTSAKALNSICSGQPRISTRKRGYKLPWTSWKERCAGDQWDSTRAGNCGQSSNRTDGRLRFRSYRLQPHNRSMLEEAGPRRLPWRSGVKSPLYSFPLARAPW